MYLPYITSPRTQHSDKVALLSLLTDQARLQVIACIKKLAQKLDAWEINWMYQQQVFVVCLDLFHYSPWEIRVQVLGQTVILCTLVTTYVCGSHS